jgi:hypothetical protein
MPNDEGNENDEARKEPNASVDLFVIRASTLIRHSSFGFRHLFVRSTPSARGLRPRITCSTWLAWVPVTATAVSLVRMVSQTPPRNRKRF